MRRSRPLSMLRVLRKRVLILGSSSTGLPSACSSTHDSTVSTSSTPSNRNFTTISVSHGLYQNYLNFYWLQGKVMFSEASVNLSTRGGRHAPTPKTETSLWTEISLKTKTPWTETIPWKEHGTRQEVTSYTPWYWNLVVATAAVGMHPTGMHSCLRIVLL